MIVTPRRTQMDNPERKEIAIFTLFVTVLLVIGFLFGMLFGAYQLKEEHKPCPVCSFEEMRQQMDREPKKWNEELTKEQRREFIKKALSK